MKNEPVKITRSFHHKSSLAWEFYSTSTGIKKKYYESVAVDSEKATITMLDQQKQWNKITYIVFLIVFL